VRSNGSRSPFAFAAPVVVESVMDFREAILRVSTHAQENCIWTIETSRRSIRLLWEDKIRTTHAFVLFVGILIPSVFVSGFPFHVLYTIYFITRGGFFIYFKKFWNFLFFIYFKITFFIFLNYFHLITINNFKIKKYFNMFQKKHSKKIIVTQ